MSSARSDNDFFIGSNGRTVAPFLWIAITTRQQAYRTAAWIKTMGETLPDEDPASTYQEVEAAVRSS